MCLKNIGTLGEKIQFELHSFLDPTLDRQCRIMKEKFSISGRQATEMRNDTRTSSIVNLQFNQEIGCSTRIGGRLMMPVLGHCFRESLLHTRVFLRLVL